MGPGPGPDLGASATELQLELVEFAYPEALPGVSPSPGQRLMTVSLTLTHVMGTGEVEAGPSRFSLLTADDQTRPPLSAQVAQSCAVGARLQMGESLSCTLVFSVGEAQRPRTLRFSSGAAQAETTFIGRFPEPVRCESPEGELSRLACSDGCTNDDDPYVDCDDSDCCGVRPDCARGTYCGGSPVNCTSGPEQSLASCLDGCDNDNDGRADCDAPGCCDLIDCPGSYFCSGQPDLFAAPLSLDDAAVMALDPSTLRAGATPCRPPALIRVGFVNDGDTFQIEDPFNEGLFGSVRMVGVDTPEIGRNGNPDDCYARNALNFTIQLRGRLVYLTFDSECMDNFDRHLAYVHIGPDSEDMMQRQLLRRGLGTTFITSENDDLADLLRHDEMLARSMGVGLHTECP